MKLTSLWAVFTHVVGSSVGEYDEVVVSPDVGGTKRASVGDQVSWQAQSAVACADLMMIVVMMVMSVCMRACM